MIFYQALFISMSIYRQCCLLFKALCHNGNSDVSIIFMFFAVFWYLISYLLKTMLGEGFQGDWQGSWSHYIVDTLKSINSYAMNVRLGCIIIVTGLNYIFYFCDRYARYITELRLWSFMLMTVYSFLGFILVTEYFRLIFSLHRQKLNFNMTIMPRFGVG